MNYAAHLIFFMSDESLQHVPVISLNNFLANKVRRSSECSDLDVARGSECNHVSLHLSALTWCLVPVQHL